MKRYYTDWSLLRKTSYQPIKLNPIYFPELGRYPWLQLFFYEHLYFLKDKPGQLAMWPYDVIDLLLY